MPQLHLKISGLVQGVCFRAYTKQTAEALHLTGWVKNCPGGSVEVLAQGDQANLEKLLAWCRHGPKLARIDKIVEKWDKDQKTFKGFNIN